MLHNAGKRDAREVHVSDSFGDTFEVTDGQLDRNLPSVGAGASMRYTVKVVPKVVGAVDSVGAVVSYSFGDGNGDGGDGIAMTHRTGMSTSLGTIVVMSPMAHTRATSYFLREWALFAASMGLPIVFSLLAHIHIT